MCLSPHKLSLWWSWVTTPRNTIRSINSKLTQPIFKDWNKMIINWAHNSFKFLSLIVSHRSLNVAVSSQSFYNATATVHVDITGTHADNFNWIKKSQQATTTKHTIWTLSRKCSQLSFWHAYLIAVDRKWVDSMSAGGSPGNVGTLLDRIHGYWLGLRCCCSCRDILTT